MTIPKNTLISYPGLENSSDANLYVIGQPITILKVYHYIGVNPETGLYQVADVNGDGLFDIKDQQSVKNLGAILYGGIQNGFDYKSLHLDFFFYFVKQQGYNDRFYMGQPGLYNQNQFRNILDNRWRKSGDLANVQLFSSSPASAAGAAFNRYKNSDAAISDASYIKLKNVYVAYTIHGKKIKSVVFFLQAQNLITITKYKGLDPEVLQNGLPMLKMYTAGIKLTLCD